MIPSWLSVSALAFLSTIAALQLPDYRGLKTSQKSGVLEITLHNRDSAINLWNEDFQSGLTDVVQKLQFDNETKVVVFKSDVPKFFCAHLDLLMPGVGKYMPQVVSSTHRLTYCASHDRGPFC
ncbi:Enoyl-CoA hydratase domain-containing protein 2, mitochondrial [Ilyonectria robusta]